MPKAEDIADILFTELLGLESELEVAVSLRRRPCPIEITLRREDGTAVIITFVERRVR